MRGSMLKHLRLDNNTFGVVGQCRASEGTAREHGKGNCKRAELGYAFVFGGI